MDGILLVNKNEGISSFGVCSKVKKKLGIKKVGHSGTLDPAASGVMTVLIGEGTKLSKYLVEHTKEYKACIKFGIKTDTADIEGNVIQEDKTFSIEQNLLKEALESLVGTIEQIPPMYSAIKVDGKKLYEYAREGKTVERKTREVEIFSISLDSINEKENEIEITVSCSKGTYIRTLCEQIAEKLGTVGYMKSLVRTKVDNYKIEECINLKDLDDMSIEEIERKIISVEKVFENRPKIDMTEKGIELLKNGVMLTYKLEDGLYKIYQGNLFIGIRNHRKKLIKKRHYFIKNRHIKWYKKTNKK